MTATNQGVSVADTAGLRLATDPKGPLALTAEDGSLGGLVLPRGVALAGDNILYLLGLNEPWIKRFDPSSRGFKRLCTIGEPGQAVRQFRQPRNIAIAGRNLYVADTGNRRMQAFDLQSLSLIHVWQLQADTYEVEPTADLNTGKAGHVFLLRPDAVAVRLRHRLEPLAEQLYGLLSAETRQLVDTYDPEQPVSDELRGRLTVDLERAAHGELAISDDRHAKQRLDTLLFRNLRLLEESYPGEVATRLWYPVDVTAQCGAAYILDRRYGRVYCHRPGTDLLKLVINRPSAANHWSRVLVDRQGQIYLLSQAAGALQLEIFDRNGMFQRSINDAGDIRDQFNAPPIRLDHQQRFCLPESLARLCDRRVPDPTPALERPLALCPPPPQAQPLRSPLLRPDDLKNVSRLALRLRRRRDPVSRYLYGRFSTAAQQQIDTYDVADPPSTALCEALRSELNRLIGRVWLYDERLFARVMIAEDLGTQLERRPQQPEDWIRLNRLLLEAAYPEAIGHYAPTKPEPLVFDRHGTRVRIGQEEPSGPTLYQRVGTWISKALDSQIYRCQWHRIELELDDLPVGTQVIVSTYTDSQWRTDDDVRNLGEHLWHTKYVIFGQMQPSSAPTASKPRYEFLVQSREGQYLWLNIRLAGDGYATPSVASVRVHYPRESYLTYLPAIYTADDQNRWFLERFLSIFQTEWDALEHRIEDIAAYFDPQAVPAGERGEFLTYLAGWLALPLEGAWNETQKRNLLTAAPRIYPRRGTLAGMLEYVQIYLQNITGLSPWDQQGKPQWQQNDPHEQPDGSQPQVGYPQIIEGFRERQRRLLSQARLGDQSQGAPLWGPTQVGRLQLDVFAREGQVRLVSTGDPERDLLHEYAHRFRIYVPSAWIRTAEDEQMLRRALDAEKPAQTRYDLCLVEPRVRVGVQSTVGLNTIAGTYPIARLACPHAATPPSRAPSRRLGYDTVLPVQPSSAAGLQLTAHTQVGINTLIA